jgi:hypothetical protein
MLRRAALHAGLPGHASTSVGGLSPPAPSFRPDMHGATRPRHSMPTGAPFAHPVGPPDDDLVELTFRRSSRSNAQPLHGTAVSSRGGDRDGLEVVAAAGARRPSAPTREQVVKKS